MHQIRAVFFKFCINLVQIPLKTASISCHIFFFVTTPHVACCKGEDTPLTKKIKRHANTPCKHTLQTHLAHTPCKHTLQTHLTNTPYKHTLQTHLANTPCKHIKHTTKKLNSQQKGIKTAHHPPFFLTIPKPSLNHPQKYPQKYPQAPHVQPQTIQKPSRCRPNTAQIPPKYRPQNLTSVFPP